MSDQTRAPYPGLRAYEPSESDLFFGREDCVDEMLRSLAETRFLAVLGNSGSGKSSLVRTGLLDALELGFLSTAGSDWKVIDMHPGGRPLNNLAAAVLRSDGSEIDDIDLNLMRGQMARGPRSLMQWCDEGNLGNDQSLLLLVDQFEELFRYQNFAGREEAEAFVALLLESATNHPRIHVVLTMRSEYLGACALMRGLAERINESLYLTPRMSRTECAEAIEGPSRVLGFEVEPRLVNHILNDMASFAPWDGEDNDSSLVQLARRADQLPLMQHVLNRLWAAACVSNPEKPVLKFSDYEAVGGLSGAVNDHAEEVLASLSADAREGAHLIFKALMSGTNISDAVRAPRPFGDLVDLVGDETIAREIVDAFRAPGCNFLRPPLAIKLDEKSIVDLGHESLIRQWNRLKDWLTEDTRASSQWLRLVTAQAAEADGAGDLLSGLDLDIAREWWNSAQPTEAWAKSRAGNFGAVQDFLRRSVAESDARAKEREKESRRKTRNLRIRAASYLIVAALAVGAAVFSINARTEAETARAEAEMERQSAVLLRQEAEQSYALALNATDTFLLDAADQLGGAIGIPDDQVDKLLARAVDYVDQLAAHDEDSPALSALRANVLVSQANQLLARGELDAARRNAEEAQRILGLSYDATDDLTSQQVEAYLDLLTFKARDNNEMRQYDDLIIGYEQARAFFDTHKHVLSDEDQFDWDLAIMNGESIARTAIDDVDVARELALDCLDQLKGASEAREVRRRLNCAISIAYSYAGERDRPQEVDDLIAETLEQSPTSQFTVSTWDNWLYLQLESLSRLVDTSRHAQAASLAGTVHSQLARLIAAEPENWDFRTRRNWTNRYLLESLIELERIDEAYVVARSAFEDVRNEPEVWGTSGSGAVSVAVVLEQVSAAAGSPPERVSPEAAARFHIDVLELQIEVMAAEDKILDQRSCLGCNLEPYVALAANYEALYELGFADLSGAHFIAHDRLHFDALEILQDEDQSDLSRAQIRRAIYQMTASLPNGDNLAEIESEETRIELLNRSIERRRAFHKRHPYASMLRIQLSDSYAALAELLFQRNGVSQAKTTLQLGVDLEGLRALSLMQQWLETGSGPFVQDIEASRAIVARLNLRDWSIAQQDTRLRRDWEYSARTEGESISVYDAPLGSSESPMSNAIQEAILQGYGISEGAITDLMAIETAAQSENLTTVRYILDRGELPHFDERNPERIAAELVRLTPKNEIVLAARMLLGIWQQVDGGEAIVSKALDVYLENETEAGYTLRLDFLETMGLTLARAEFYELGILVHSNLVERADLFGDLARHAGLLRQRGSMHREAGNHEAKNNDYLTALAIAPDDPRLLNSIGYGWADDDSLLPAAIDMLERAVELERQSPGSASLHFYLDSLGWLYVRDGNLERGMEKLQEAIAIDAEPQAEILFHVGETFRRMGDPEQAMEYFNQALQIAGRSDIREQIYRQSELADAAMRE